MLELTENFGAIKGNVNRQPTLRNRIYQIVRTFRFKGVRASLAHYYRRIIHILLRTTDAVGAEPPEAFVPSRLDERFAPGSFESPLRELAIQSPNAKWGLPYAPTHPEFFEQVVSNLPVQLTDYNFIDLGAGKGLALLLAAKYPFQSITGVEYSKVLADMAAENISEYQEHNGGHSSIQCVWGDAASFDFPHKPTVLYLFNPFQGKVMDCVIKNIENSLKATPRDLWVIYGIPWEGRKFRRSPMLETIEWNSDYSVHRSACR
jgi:hypothetical protein